MTMSSFWKSKKFRLILLSLIVMGLFLYAFWLFQSREEVEIKESEISSSEIRLPVSSVYRYDFKEMEYLSDKGESWQNLSFTRYIYDLAPEGQKLEKCYYITYDSITKQAASSGHRKCNANLTITIGENQQCPSQGENACVLYAYATDDSGRQGEMTAVSYHIDWQKPIVEKVFKEGNIFLVDVSDNTAVDYCWLYINGKAVGPMWVEGGSASIDYSDDEEIETAFVRCADHYEPEKEGYLNVGFGEMLEMETDVNYAPKIFSCRVLPSHGTVETNFRFAVEGSDPDGNVLSFHWDFGDGESSVEETPIHQYETTGVFEPKITVSDGQETDICSTAWVVVSE